MKPYHVYRAIDSFVKGRCNTTLRIALLKCGWPWEPIHVVDEKLGPCRVRSLRSSYFVHMKIKAEVDRFFFRWSPLPRYRLARYLVNSLEAKDAAPVHRRVLVRWFPLLGLFIRARD